MFRLSKMPPAKDKATKEKVDPKKQLSDLLAQNEQLLAEVENARKGVATANQKLSTIMLRMIESVDDRYVVTLLHVSPT